MADWLRSPEAEALSGEPREVLGRDIDTLRDHYRAVLILRDVE